MWIYVEYLMDKYKITEEEAKKAYKIMKRNKLL